MPDLGKLLPLAALLVAFERNAPLVAQGSAPPPSPSTSAPPRVEPTTAEADALRPLMEAYEAEFRKLREERDHWQAEAVLCQARLERAEQRLEKTEAMALTAVGDHPEVQVTGGDVLVTAQVFNLGDRVARGTAAIVLLRDGEVVATAKEPVSIAPSSDLSVTHRFPGLAGKGTFSAKVSFDP